MRRAVVGSSGSNTSGASSSCPRPAAVNHRHTHHLYQAPSGPEQRGWRSTRTRLSAANSSSSSSDGFARNEAQPRRIDSVPNQPKTLVRVKYQVTSLSTATTHTFLASCRLIIPALCSSTTGSTVGRSSALEALTSPSGGRSCPSRRSL
jgi:hypothetical protein